MQSVAKFNKTVETYTRWSSAYSVLLYSNPATSSLCYIFYYLKYTNIDQIVQLSKIPAQVFQEISQTD